jgi:hypothetical protein
MILDVRSGEDNSKDTGLSLRRVDGHVSFIGGEPVRMGRVSHAAVGDLGDVLFLASGDGDIGVTSRPVTFKKLFTLGVKHYYGTGLRDGIVNEVRGEGGQVLRLLYGGSVVESETDDLVLGVGDVGLGFWWTRNDVERVRFEHRGASWSLLKGGAGEDVGVVGGELESLNSLDGVLRVGDRVYDIGVDIPVEEDDSRLSEFVAIVLSGTGELLFSGSEVDLGDRVIHLRGSGAVNGWGGLVSGDYLSPRPSPCERPLLRDGHRGYMEVRRVVDFSAEVDFGVVELKASGEIKVSSLLSGELSYDGLVLGHLVLDDGHDLGGAIGSVDIPVDMLPDGTGLKPVGSATSFRNDGSGLVYAYRNSRHWVSVGGELLEVLFVDELPRRLDRNFGYVERGSRRVILNASWSGEVISGGHRLYLGEVSCVLNRVVSHLSSKNWGVDSGVFTLTNGEEISFDKVSVTGAGVSLEVGHLVLDEGLEVSALSDISVLKGVGLIAGSSTGLVLELGGGTVSGYYSYEEESVGDVSGTDYQLLTFDPRQDFSNSFKVGDKVLIENEDYIYVSDPRGFRWVVSQQLSGEIREPTSRLFLGHGVMSNTSSLTLKRELVEGGIESVDYTEGVGYNLEGSQLTLKRDVGEELTRGVGVGEGMELIGGDVSLISSGDWINWQGYFYKVESLNGVVVSLSGSVSRGSGIWIAYKGYREGVLGLETPDSSRLCGEVFSEIRAGGEVVVYKVYNNLALGSSGLGSSHILRSGDIDVPLYILREENVEAPQYVFAEGDAHVTSGSYVLRVGGVDYQQGVAQGIYRFVVEGDRFVFQVEDSGIWSEDASWVEGDVILRRVPRVGLQDWAEVSLTGDDLSSPFESFDQFLTSEEGVTFNKSSGAISFAEPLERGLGVEVSYVGLDGVRVLETLIFSVLGEVMTRESERSYVFNGVGLEVELEVTPSVYVNSELISGHLYSFGPSEVIFKFDVEAEAQVKISYGVLNTLGGEQAVRLSGSILNTAFKIGRGEGDIVTPKDLRGEVEVGDIVKVGNHIFNITSVSSNLLGVSPPARFGVESSRLQLLAVPVLTYDGQAYTNSFLSLIGCELRSAPNSSDIYIKGDFRDHFLAKSILIVSGVPYQVFQVSLTDEGYTQITIDGFSKGHSITSTAEGELAVSYRPIYEGGETELSLTTGVISNSDFTLMRFDHTVGRGQQLYFNKDFKIDLESGLISLLTSRVSAYVSYYLYHTAISTLSPQSLYGGRVSYPSYNITYKRATPPTQYEGLELLSSAVVYAPDSFYVRSVEVGEYASEISSRLLDRLKSVNGNGAKREFTDTNPRGNSIGFFDLIAEDAVSRERISLYEGYIKPVEDLVSTSTGHVVGDLDGRFKFEVEQSGDWGGAGLEDPVTKEIQPRFIFQEILDPLNPLDIYPDPLGVIKVNGLTPDIGRLQDLMRKQSSLVRNEIDDYVLTKTNTVAVVNSFFEYAVELLPVYQQLWKPSRFSRLFPTQTRVQTLRLGGDLFADRDGRSTNGQPIAYVENGSLGQIENVTSLTLKKRPARFRVVDYSSKGFGDISGLSIGKPTFLVSATPLDEFPLTAQGLPDTARFLSQGGDLPDASFGSLDLTFRGLSIGSHVALSVESDLYPLMDVSSDSELPDSFGLVVNPAPRYVKVEAVVLGCLVILEGSSFNIEVNSVSLNDLKIKRGDTLVESLEKDLDDDSASLSYRVGSDVGLNYATGEIIDISLPSLSDPSFPFQEISGQNVPPPLTALEGIAGFTYGSVEPFTYPALEGLALDDAGDEGIPYLRRLSERVILAETPKLQAELVREALNASSGLEESVYPDEVRDSSSTISQGVINISTDVSSLTGLAEQVPRQGDLILISPDTTNTQGASSTGVLELALCNETEISPPHFQASTVGNSFSLTNLAVDLEGDPSKGVTVRESLIFNAVTNEWDSSQSVFTFAGYSKVDSIIDKILNDGGSLTIHLHDYNDTSEVFKVILSYDGSWSMKTVNKSGVEVIAANTTVTGYALDSIEITQDPIPNPLTVVEEPLWPANTHETWLYNGVSISHFWGAMVGFRFFTSQGSDRVAEISLSGTYPALYLDYRLDVEFGLSSSNYINSNRLDFHTDLNFNTWVYSSTSPSVLLEAGGGVIPLNVSSLIDILSSKMQVNEINGVNTHFVSSDINTNQIMGYSPYSLEGDSNMILGDHVLRFKSLHGVNRPSDSLSLFVGSEVNTDGNICSGLGSLGSYTQFNTEDKKKGVVQGLTLSQGSISHVEEGDVIYLNSGHSSGTHRVKAVIKEAVDETVSLVLGDAVLPVIFPKVVSSSLNLDGSVTILTDSDNLSNLFFSTGLNLISIILNSNYLTAPSSSQVGVYDQAFSTSFVRVSYDSISSDSFTVSLDAEYADGTAVSVTDLPSLLGAGGQLIAGIHKVLFRPLKTGLFRSEHPIDVDSNFEFSLQVAGGIAGNSAELQTGEDFDGNAVLLVPNSFNIGGQWFTSYPEILDGVGNSYGLSFLLPQDAFQLRLSCDQGIVLDRAFPRLWRNYQGTTPTLFNDGSSQVISLEDYTLTDTPAWPYYEEVTFVVRRLRRFTDLFSKLIYNLEGYRYLYEKRSGQVESVTRDGDLITVTPLKIEGQATNVGEIPETISVGDDVVCYTALGEESLKIRVSETLDNSFKGRVVYGEANASTSWFEVIVKENLVPQIQSFDSLVSHGFEVSYATQAVLGIEVSAENVLTDNNTDFTQILSGDDLYYLVIDPQGLLQGTATEYGQPAMGDPDSLSLLDDNRGSYLVTSFTTNTLTVAFKGRTDFLPDVNGLKDNPLRVTSGVDNGSYLGSSNSVHPFSYRLLKKKSYLDQGLAEDILFFRERTLSWVEKIRKFNDLPSEALSWTDYEQGDYIEVVGEYDHTHPSNDLLVSTLLGDGSYPFSSDLLSVNDRRLLIEDPQMVMEGHSSLEGMPSLLESGISSMGARGKRDSWINARTNQIEGTLSRLSRVDLETLKTQSLEDINE